MSRSEKQRRAVLAILEGAQIAWSMRRNILTGNHDHSAIGRYHPTDNVELVVLPDPLGASIATNQRLLV